MKYDKGTTLVELMVVLAIGGLIISAAGSVTNIARRSHSKIARSATIYNDIAYGFKLMQRKIRESSNVVRNSTVTNSWIGEKLNVDNHAFGVYSHSGSSQRDFVYLPDKNVDSIRETIFSVFGSDLLNAVYTVNYALNETKVGINLSGVRSSILFNMTTTVKTRR